MSHTAVTLSSLNSAIYTGKVQHRRYTESNHQFIYSIYMLGLDLDELEVIDRQQRFFSLERFNYLSFRRRDYLKGSTQSSLKDAVISQVKQLGGERAIERVMMLGQVRCLGLYFNPVNFYFCYRNGEAIYMLAEVHNTPWNESHCYLVDLENPQHTDKAFHVSPFMNLEMCYHWHVRLRQQRILVHIENWNTEKLFDATLALKRKAFEPSVLLQTLRQWPIMSLSILRGIYWQALRLFSKRVTFYSHP